MRTKIMSGIVGVVVCAGVAVGSGAPASAADAGSVSETAVVVVAVDVKLPDVRHVPQSPCIDCW
ncbi:hypothetical protein [Nocardioides sp. 1609]|uniref:hypothetical protein n=1 Tax=Nocardioides sp. 1609 TaxID=2508327 RepID=UPI00106FD40D|nr:hypothetical protein [Nocardioides sp. 1609]